ncbi:E4 SUMO-protein ligase PIAL2 isoform X2 [Helianthus annuus]|uniref:E4 SUMO-protein ligase PIAL2 isoform X2 n=1 Tax=Helianthus annuus TaxID=4232 RepID=UPI000B8EF1FE|nr:E4 SUMO-protein ligase PIAL2 isoform X2 [Helianthus annuus]
MAGVVINPAQAPNGSTTSSCGKTFHISTAVDRLFAHVRGGLKNDVKEICNLCIHLSRGIDSAVSNNEIPDRALELPYLLKQVCQWTSDRHLLTAIMVLMISMKGACRNGWFGEKDNEELHKIWTELATSFCSVRDMNFAENTANHSISTVLSRFYPRMKMGKILAFIEATPGYGAFVKDFHITKNAKSPNEEVCLFVAQIDNMETSSCITSPQLVNFLLNGKAVDRRTCISKDPGPQIPTPITDLVKNGTNLLQAVGQFNGKYIIVVAFMSVITNPSCPALPDYMPPVAAASDLDNDIVEGPSRISLNCPISFKRITTPVKGHLCKHLQCFDFENYVDINSRRPSWRCPHCSQSVCFTDIRIDQVMAKVLKDVGGTISHVNFSADGSWETFNECDDHADKQQDKSLHQQSNPSTNTGGDIMDLTKGDTGNDIDASNPHQENEKKPSLAQLQNQNECGTSDTRSNVAVSQGQSQTLMSGFNNMQLPLPTHAIGTSSTVTSPNLQGQSQTENSAYSMQYQQHNMNSMSNGYGQRYMTPSRQVTRIPIAIQGLPAQTPAGMVNTDRQQQYSRFYMDQYQGMRTIAASNPSVSENIGSQNWVRHGLSNVSSHPAQQFGAHSGPFYQSDGHHFNSHQQQSYNLPNLVQPPFVGPTIGQVSNQQAHQYVDPTTGSISNQQAHHYVGPTAGSVSNQQAHQYVDPTTGSISNQQAHHYVGPTTGSVSNQQTRHYVPPMTGSISNQLAHQYVKAAASQASQITGGPTPAPVQTSLSTMPVISSEEQRGLGQAFRTQEGSALANALADPNWRPSVRMRGSLSGRAYSEALSQAMVHPTQPAQAASPLVLNTPRPFIPPHLQVLIANNMNANSFQEGAGGSVVDGSGGGGVLFP